MPAPTPGVRVSTAAAAAGPGEGKVGVDPGAPFACDKLGVAVGAGTACVPEIARVGALVPDVGAATAGLAFVGVVVAAADCTRPLAPAVSVLTGGVCRLAPSSRARCASLVVCPVLLGGADAARALGTITFSIA